VARKRTDVTGTAVARGQTPEEVLDRNLAELLQEIRVAITGVQILFAFLLTMAFTTRFDELDAFGTTVYTVTLLSTATATLVLIAPVSFHRTLFRQRRKEQLVAFADSALLVGLGLLFLGITAAVLLVLDVVLGRWPAIICSAFLVVVGTVTWYVVPLRQRRSSRR
jgi:Flp pilus assembly protein TadB